MGLISYGAEVRAHCQLLKISRSYAYTKRQEKPRSAENKYPQLYKTYTLSRYWSGLKTANRLCNKAAQLPEQKLPEKIRCLVTRVVRYKSIDYTVIFMISSYRLNLCIFPIYLKVS